MKNEIDDMISLLKKLKRLCVVHVTYNGDHEGFDSIHDIEIGAVIDITRRAMAIPNEASVTLNGIPAEKLDMTTKVIFGDVISYYDINKGEK